MESAIKLLYLESQRTWNSRFETIRLYEDPIDGITANEIGTNYSICNDIKINVADGTNATTKKTNLIYAKPIISIKQEERWDVTIMNNVIPQVEFYSFDPLAIPHRYNYHQDVTC